MIETILESRKSYESSEDFRDAFLSSLTPGVIKRTNFIKWESIGNKTAKYKKTFGFFKQLQGLGREQFIKTLADSLMSADVAAEFISASFELLGHTGDNYVSDRDHVVFRKFCDSEKSDVDTFYIAELLYELGLDQVTHFELEDYFVGVQVGLETHRRKNIGGSAFSAIIEEELNKIVISLKERGVNVMLKKENQVLYIDEITSKTVDFLLTSGSKNIGIEINFYTSSGSKPTEIKRSYGLINKELESVNTLLAWVTDGVGYEKMKKSLKEARDIHKNIYNFNMFKESFIEDTYAYFSND